MGLSDSLLRSGCFLKFGVDGDVNGDGAEVFEKNGLLIFWVILNVVAGASEDTERGEGGTGKDTAVGDSEKDISVLVFGGECEGE